MGVLVTQPGPVAMYMSGKEKKPSSRKAHHLDCAWKDEEEAARGHRGKVFWKNTVAPTDQGEGETPCQRECHTRGFSTTQGPQELWQRLSMER